MFEIEEFNSEAVDEEISNANNPFESNTMLSPIAVGLMIWPAELAKLSVILSIPRSLALCNWAPNPSLVAMNQ